MVLKQFELELLQEQFPDVSPRALERVPAESLSDPDQVSAHIELWNEAEARTAMLHARIMKIAERQGPRLPGGSGCNFADQAERYAGSYLCMLERALDRGESLTQALIDQTFLATLKEVREFETVIADARAAGNPAMRRAPAGGARL
jgi:hypothetical protein